MNRRSGFTLIEIILVVALVGILAALLVPNIRPFIHRSRFEGFMRQAQAHVNQAKLEAVRRSVPVVVWVDDRATPLHIVAFADVHGDTQADPPDPEVDDPAYKHLAGQPQGTTDYIVGGPLTVPAVLSLSGPGGANGGPFMGLTGVNPDGLDLEQAVVFQNDGSVLDTGAIRFGDQSGNFLELLVAPQATARITIRKYHPVDLAWYEFGEGGEHWTWY